MTPLSGRDEVSSSFKVMPFFHAFSSVIFPNFRICLHIGGDLAEAEGFERIFFKFGLRTNDSSARWKLKLSQATCCGAESGDCTTLRLLRLTSGNRLSLLSREGKGREGKGPRLAFSRSEPVLVNKAQP